MDVSQLTDVEVMYMTEQVRSLALKWCKSSMETFGPVRWLIGQSGEDLYAITGQRETHKSREPSARNVRGKHHRVNFIYLRAHDDGGIITTSNLKEQRAFLDVVNQKAPFKMNELYANVKETCLAIEQEIRITKTANKYREVFRFSRDDLDRIRDHAVNTLNEDLLEVARERLGEGLKVTLTVASQDGGGGHLFDSAITADRTGYTLYEALQRFNFDKILAALPSAEAINWRGDISPDLVAQRFAIVYGGLCDRAVGMVSGDPLIREAVQTRNEIEPRDVAKFLGELNHAHGEHIQKALNLRCRITEEIA